MLINVCGIRKLIGDIPPLIFCRLLLHGSPDLPRVFMKSSYSFEAKETHLEMKISGAYDYWEFIDYPGIIRAQCERVGKFRVIVDMTSVTYDELPTLEMFFLGEKLAEKLRDRVKIALVWRKGQQDYFLENVAANRAASIRTFDTILKARTWLLFDLEDEPFNFQGR
jgi:hypothetical protein